MSSSILGPTKNTVCLLTFPFQSRLGVSRSASYTSLFQAFVNYRQGLRRSTKWNTTDEVELHAIEIGVPKVAYDVTLEMVDYEDGDCVQTLVVRKDLYDQDQASMLVESYERLLEAFVDDPSLSLDQPNLFTPGNMEKAIAFSRGKRHLPENRLCTGRK